MSGSRHSGVSAARRTTPPPGRRCRRPGRRPAPAAAVAARQRPPAVPGASSSETLSSSAADSLPSTTAVGLLSPRSILLIIARETPDAAASRSIGQPRARRSPRSRSPNAAIVSTIVDMDPLYKIRLAEGGGRGGDPRHPQRRDRALDGHVDDASPCHPPTGGPGSRTNLARRSAYVAEAGGAGGRLRQLGAVAAQGRLPAHRRGLRVPDRAATRAAASARSCSQRSSRAPASPART